VFSPELPFFHLGLPVEGLHAFYQSVVLIQRGATEAQNGHVLFSSCAPKLASSKFTYFESCLSVC